MALWSAPIVTWTPVAVADTVAMTDGGHHTLQGGSATQRIKMVELMIGGQANAAAVCLMLFGRTSTVGATLTAQRLAALDPATAALAAPPVSYGASTTKPQRSATLGALLNLPMNAYGGGILWKASPGEDISLLGNTASLGELSLNAFTGGAPGLIGTHFIVETL